MTKNQYRISLTSEQRRVLKSISENESAPTFKVRNARILLSTDSGIGGGKRLDVAIAKEFNLSVSTIERIQKRFVERGLRVAVNQRLRNKDTNLVVNYASDSGTFVNFGAGQIAVTPTSTALDFGVGSVGVGGNGATVVNFPGGGVNADGLGTSIAFPGGGVAIGSEGVVVDAPGVTANVDGDTQSVTFTGGNVFVATGGGTIRFPNGFVNYGDGAIVVNAPGFSGLF